MAGKMENIVEIQEAKNIGAKEKLAAYYELTKPRIAFMLVLTAAAGFYVGSDAGFNWILFINTIIGITLLAFGVATLNQVIERNLDGLMERTEKRPLPSGRLSTMEALVFGSLLCITSEIYIAFLVNYLTAFLGLVVIVGYVFLYTPLKTKTSASTAIGALPGALPPLMGFTAAANEITLGAWAMFAILFLWQFPHFLAIAWMYREEYRKAGILMLPVLEKDGKITASQIVLFTILLIPVSFAPFFLGMAGLVYLSGAILLGGWFLLASIQAARFKSVAQARKLMLVSVLYLPIIFALLVFNH
jgi:protoheme IX farnesyltransferase